MADNLLDAIAEFHLSPANVRPNPTIVSSLIRDLTLEDVERLETAPVPPPAPVSTLSRIRDSHRELARVLARGATVVEASVATGYATSTITALKSDPAFQELLVYFSQMRDQEFLDAQKRLALLGHDALEEIHERLRANPEGFDLRTLLNIVQSTFDRSVAPSKSGGGARALGAAGPSPAVSVNISFTDPTPGGHVETIELKARDVTSES